MGFALMPWLMLPVLVTLFGLSFVVTSRSPLFGVVLLGSALWMFILGGMWMDGGAAPPAADARAVPKAPAPIEP
ncbi:MAG: hypothetical protein ACOC8E_00315 [Planctomycetota bacterium]